MQLVHGVQLVALRAVLYVALGHAAHVRSTTELPSTAMAFPARQSVHAAHAVAALPSWSHVPLAQACLGTSVPAQYVPTSQGLQTAGELGVAAAVCSVPAAQTSCGVQEAWFGEDA
ncbi:hypothetical protein [Labilithrix luteola]|uniref:hypothetical protein n=1 Tax=Labilithrix luteola TaxID=1391654 RepID=UPI003B838515